MHPRARFPTPLSAQLLLSHLSQAEGTEATKATEETAEVDNDDAAKKEEEASFIFGSPAFQTSLLISLPPSLAGGGAGAEEAEGLV